MSLAMQMALEYNQRIRAMLAQREAEAALQKAEQSQSMGGLAEIAGTYAGKKYGPSIANSIFGSSPAAGETIAASEGASTLPSLATASSYALPVAATIFGLYQANRAREAFNNGNPTVAGIAGSLAGGVGIGGPLALATYLNKKFWDPDKWKTEGNRLNSLKDKGYTIPQNLIDSMPTSGRKDKELINSNYASDFMGRGKLNEWINNKFATSRNEADLRPEDVVNYGAFAEKFGKNYFDVPLAQRLAASKIALDAGALDEHHGTIDFNDKLNAELQNKISSILNPATTAANAKGKQSGSKLGASLGDVLVNFKKG